MPKISFQNNKVLNENFKPKHLATNQIKVIELDFKADK